MIRSIFNFIAYIAILTKCLPAPAERPANTLTESEKRGGWRLIFDGKSTKGWRNFRKESISDGWRVKDGALSRVGNGVGDIVSVDQYGDFELSLEYRISKSGNSGIMFRVTEEAPQPWHTGPEVQIQDNIAGRDPQKAGWLYQLYKPVKPDWAKKFEAQVGFKSPDVDDATRPPGEWNHVYLRVASLQCEVAVNGVSYYYFKIGDDEWNKRVANSKFAKFKKFGKAKQGHICLQDHGDPVSFRNIKIRKLAADGSVPNPIDGTLPLKLVEAFPNMKWEGWSGIDQQGKVQALRPIEMTHAADGSNRLFVACQRGMVYVFDNDPKVKQAKLLLDIRGQVHNFAKDNEEGLLGLALHPKFKTNGHFFVYYNHAKEPRVAYLSRFTVSKETGRADLAGEVRLMRFQQPFSNHNGGPMTFGNDGYLYLGLGDGGGRNDPKFLAQNLSSLMGKILRIDVDRKGRRTNYSFPKDNPFIPLTAAAPEIYAYGIRNPWRLTRDMKTGSIWIADVGQDLWEEINILRRGGNYGWSIREASYGFGNSKAKPHDPPIDPVWEYDHRVGKSITGGYVWRSPRLPELDGCYIYGDYVSGKLWALKYDQQKNQVEKNFAIPTTGLAILSFGQDEAGEVYYIVASVRGRCIFRFERTE